MVQSIKFLDSFDHYSTSQGLQKWTIGDFGGDVTIGAYGRNSTNGLRISNDRSTVTKTIPGGPAQDLVFGAAVFIQTSLSDFDGALFDFRDDGTSQVKLKINFFTRLLELRRGATLLATGTRVLNVGVWYSIEMAVHIADPAGTVTVRVNEQNEIVFTGVTKVSANASANIVALGYDTGGNNGAVKRFDDVYLATGGLSFYGDLRVFAQFPTADGAHTNFTPSAGANRYTRVNEVVPDEDTTYNFDANVGDRDSFPMTTIADTPIDIKAIQYVYRAKTSAPGARSIKGFFRSQAGVDYDNAHAEALTDAYLFPAGAIEMLNPETGLPFTRAEINSGQFGYKVEA